VCPCLRKGMHNTTARHLILTIINCFILFA